MERDGLNFVRILIELVCLVSLFGLIALSGRLATQWERQDQIRRTTQELERKALEINDIANPHKEYTPSEVAEIIVTYGDKYTYIVDSLINGVKQEHLIERDSEEHNKARAEAQNLLNSGRLKGVYQNKGDQYNFIDDFLWSADYLQTNVCYAGTDSSQKNYIVKIQTADPLVEGRWNEYGAGDEHCYPENVVRSQFRIHYTPKP